MHDLNCLASCCIYNVGLGRRVVLFVRDRPTRDEIRLVDDCINTLSSLHGPAVPEGCMRGRREPNLTQNEIVGSASRANVDDFAWKADRIVEIVEEDEVRLETSSDARGQGLVPTARYLRRRENSSPHRPVVYDCEARAVGKAVDRAAVGRRVEAHAP